MAERNDPGRRAVISNLEIEAVVARKNPIPQQMMPSLVAVQMSGGWAVISDDKRRPLTQVEAHGLGIFVELTTSSSPRGTFRGFYI